MAITINGTTGIAGVDGSASTPAVQGTDTNTGIYFGSDTISFTEGGTQVGEFDSSANFKFNSGYGSVATAYGCRAWVDFNGTGVIAIRGSGNVSSITDNGTGDYTVNFTNALSFSNYAVIASANLGSPMRINGYGSGGSFIEVAPTTSSCRMYNGNLTTGSDPLYVTVAIFR